MAGILEVEKIFDRSTFSPIGHSTGVLGSYMHGDLDLFREFTRMPQEKRVEKMIMGEIPLISAHDRKLLPEGTRIIKVPENLKHEIQQAEARDLIEWNSPERFLERLKAKEMHPVNSEARSNVMEHLTVEGQVVSFDDLRVVSPSPEGKPRMSRSKQAYNGLQNLKIMGRGRMPLMLGAVPDVASRESYTKAAIAGAMVTASRDKIWSDPANQTKLIGTVINDLRTLPIPDSMKPNERQLEEFWKITGKSANSFNENVALESYMQELRNSWIANVGAAIEASPKGINRAQMLYDVGCRMFRIYSPEGGHEIVETVKGLKDLPQLPKDSKIIAGQIMDVKTAQAAVEAGCDSIIIGVAGGSQCTTSINADIAVNTPNLLYELRKANLKVPIGIEGGGVGTHMMTAIALGATYFSKPGEIGVSLAGTGDYVFEDPQGNWHVLYGGEASNSAKMWRPDSFDSQGRIRFPEGEGGARLLSKKGDFDPDNLDDRRSIIRNIERLMFAEAVGLVFQRIPTIDEIHAKDSLGVVRVSENASALSHPYAR